MVKALHRAGIEVILDVVYNHTAEGNHLGPMLSFRGIDNAVVLPAAAGRPAPLHGLHGHRQHAQPGAPERAAADHGLAALLGDRVPRRRLPLRPRLGARARVLRRRPPVRVLRRHPPGPGALAGEADRRAVGRRAGRLPGRQLPGALERVERHLPRRRARLLARAGPGVGEFASRFTGSSDLYQSDGRTPFASINFVTAHDGFTLRDLVSYNEKHNEANLEDDRDGTDDNRSWNCGVEGETDDPDGPAAARAPAAQLPRDAAPLAGRADAARRRRDRRARQGGNNNAWCQDNEISWFDWELDEAQRGPARVHAPADRPAPRATRCSAARSFLEGAQVNGSGLPDVWWFRPDGRRMTQPDWESARLARRRLPQRRGDRRRTSDGERIVDDSFLLLFNAGHDDVAFRLPSRRFGAQLDATSCARPTRRSGPHSPHARRPRRACCVVGRSMQLLRRVA